jgi:hypothetical protein
LDSIPSTKINKQVIKKAHTYNSTIRQHSVSLLKGQAPWITAVILATQEVAIRSIKVQSQPRQIVPEPLSQKYLTQKGLVEWLNV